MIRYWRKLPKASIEHYKILEEKVLEEQALEEKIIKDREEWQRNKKDKILNEIKESLKTEFAELDLLEKNTQALKKLNCSGCEFITNIPNIVGLKELDCSSCCRLVSIQHIEGLCNIKHSNCKQLSYCPNIKSR